MPQVLLNVPVPDTGLLDGAEAVWSAVAEEEERLGDSGRVAAAAERDRAPGPGHGGGLGDGVAEEIADRLGNLVGFELQAAPRRR